MRLSLVVGTGPLVTAALVAATHGMAVAQARGPTPEKSGPSVADTAVLASPYYSGPVDTLAARQLSGCYAVRVGGWSDPRANGGRIVTPAEIRLDTTHIAHPYPGRPLAVETPGFINPSHFAVPPRWGPVKHDSLQATVVASQTSSVTIFARRHADSTFTAIARYFTDAIATDPFTNRWMWETYPTAPVQLVPHACASAR